MSYREKALEIRRKYLGETNEKTAQSYDDLGTCYWDKGDILLGLEYKERAADIRQQLGIENELTADNCSRLAHYCQELGKTKKALLFADRSMDIRRRIGSEPDETMLGDYQMMLSCSEELEENDKAEYYRREIKKVKKYLFLKRHLPWAAKRSQKKRVKKIQKGE